MSEKNSVGYGLRRIADALVFLGIAGLIGWDCQTEKSHRHQQELTNELKAHVSPTEGKVTDSLGTNNLTKVVQNDLYSLGMHIRRWDLSIWRNIYATTSKPAIIHWGTNEIRIPAGSDIDITFEEKERK